MELIFSAPATPVVPVIGSTALFPVHRIYCVGRNYAEHSKEMGGTGREAPFFFMKPADAADAVPNGTVGQMPYPSKTSNLHHEVELVVAIGKGGANISVQDAQQHIWGYAVGLDMTRRDLQAQSKEQGRPWCTAKGFDHSAPIGPIVPAAAMNDLQSASIKLTVNGDVRQQSQLSKMTWNIHEIISELSQFYALQPGDLIFTGTPEGVGAVQKGDILEAEIDGLGQLTIAIS
ncbi:fumarylacetoacetate hydrolase family protein [Undibacterium sp. RuRC25W]|uniref:fumarylacetoacetate hydrolase family protein n=1 Tax=Undibacterium sp. RuRC25W TaxID=3413047 RepID=UPI003BF1FC41